jgi:hypothetical protein
MIQARWLVKNECRLADGAGGWPLHFPWPAYHAPESWLSALTQGNAISVLVRAFRLTGEDVFLHVARRAVRTFELDIRDRGVSTVVGDNGIFFEEVAAYPAAHILNGYILAIIGLYDYVALTGDRRITALIRRSLATLHTMIDRFDMGYWSRYDLLHQYIADHFYHHAHSILLEALFTYSGCEHCAALAARWAACQRSVACRLRYLVASRAARYLRGLRLLGIQGVLFHLFMPAHQRRRDESVVQSSMKDIQS